MGSNAGALVTSGIVGPIDNIVVGIDVQVELGGSLGCEARRGGGRRTSPVNPDQTLGTRLGLTFCDASDEDWVNWLSDLLANAELEYAPVTLFVQELP